MLQSPGGGGKAARDRDITLKAVKAIYVDGSAETIPVRTRVDAGGTYGPIELKGERRQAIDDIEAKVWIAASLELGPAHE
jgi:hypothetical protein